jgi:hypothetical protein
MLTGYLSGIRRHALSAKYLTILYTLWWNKLFGAQIKPLQLVIIIYSNEAERIWLAFLYCSCWPCRWREGSVLEQPSLVRETNDGTLHEIHPL